MKKFNVEYELHAERESLRDVDKTFLEPTKAGSMAIDADTKAEASDMAEGALEVLMERESVHRCRIKVVEKRGMFGSSDSTNGIEG